MQPTTFLCHIFHLKKEKNYYYTAQPNSRKQFFTKKCNLNFFPGHSIKCAHIIYTLFCEIINGIWQEFGFCKIIIISKFMQGIFHRKNGTKSFFQMDIFYYLPFCLLACQHDNQTHPPCANVHQRSMHRLMYSTGLRKTVQNNDVHDDALIDIVGCVRPLYDAASNRIALKYL